MPIGHRAACAGFVFILSLPVTGCRTGGATNVRVADSELPAFTAAIAEASEIAGLPVTLPANEIVASPPSEEPGVTLVQPVAYSAQPTEELLSPLPASDGQPAATLEVESLVAEVLAVNPDIRAAAAAWRAAAQRYPQEVSLDDPMFGFMLGPGSWGSDEVNDAYTLEASQKIPWPGKRQLRGDIARAEANAAYFDVGEQRLRIAEAARLAYYQYYLAHRQLAVLAESTGLLRDFREIALSRYESATVEQQDVLLADVELAEQQRRLLELTRQERVARARINTLLLVEPDGSLPPPPVTLPTSGALLSTEELRSLAIAERPELAAQAARIRAERYAVSLAAKEFYPDLELVSRYDAFWQEEPLRPMVGMNLNVPLYKQKRWAAVAEARARIAKEQADFDAKTVEIAFEVEQTYRRVEESQQTLKVYEESILPTARHSIDAARASYLAGRLDFLRLVESQRQLLSLQDRYYEAMANYQQRVAELERLVGASPTANELGQ